VFAQVRRALAELLDPLTGGPAGTGWPFGRDVHASEVFAVVEKVPLVNYIEDVTLARAGGGGGGDGGGGGGGEPGGPEAAATGRIRLEDDQLVRLTTVGLVAFDSGGKRHPERGADVALAVVPPVPAEVPLAPAPVMPAPEPPLPVPGGGG
jgi:hypothetical protein